MNKVEKTIEASLLLQQKTSELPVATDNVHGVCVLLRRAGKLATAVQCVGSLDAVMRVRNHIRLQLLWVTIGVCALVTPEAALAGGPANVTVLCGHRNMYESAATALIESLKKKGHNCQLVEWPKSSDKSGRQRVLDQITASKPNIIVASGSSATSDVLDQIKGIPVVFYMVPNALDAPFMTSGARDQERIAGIAADISPTERIRWIKQLDMSTKRLGLLYSQRTKKTMESFREAARRHGVEIIAVETSRDLIPDAIETLSAEHVDGVLMIPDAAIYNSASVQRLLLWGARQKKPVWSFSQSIVKAGAFGGQYANDEALGRQTADLVQRILDGTPPSKLGLQFPDQIESAVNTHTSDVIELELKDSILRSNVVRFGDQQ